MGDERRREAIAAGRDLLETGGEAALTMRRLADRLGIRAPSLYKHIPDKATLEAEIVAEGLREAGAALAAADRDLRSIALAYRTWALAHPHLYGLMTARPLPRERLPAGVEADAAAPLRDVVDDDDRARAAWAAAHGLVTLEIADRFPPAADLDAAWDAMVEAFGAQAGSG